MPPTSSIESRYPPGSYSPVNQFALHKARRNPDVAYGMYKRRSERRVSNKITTEECLIDIRNSVEKFIHNGERPNVFTLKNHLLLLRKKFPDRFNDALGTISDVLFEANVECVCNIHKTEQLKKRYRAIERLLRKWFPDINLTTSEICNEDADVHKREHITTGNTHGEISGIGEEVYYITPDQTEPEPQILEQEEIIHTLFHRIKHTQPHDVERVYTQYFDEVFRYYIFGEITQRTVKMFISWLYQYGQESKQNIYRLVRQSSQNLYVQVGYEYSSVVTQRLNTLVELLDAFSNNLIQE